MLIVLPPSETKRHGGDGPALDLGRLALPHLADIRSGLVSELSRLAADIPASRRALKVGPRGDAEIARNAVLLSSPTLAALDRYTGVLYDALDAATLPSHARAAAGRHLVIHSALFGLVGALDPIPGYRLSHDSRLGESALPARWRGALTTALAAHDGPILDLRSEGYASLGPRPDRPDSLVLRVVSRGPDGAVRALNHFNKKGKGLFTRALLSAEVMPETVPELLAWASAADVALELEPESRALILTV